MDPTLENLVKTALPQAEASGTEAGLGDRQVGCKLPRKIGNPQREREGHPRITES